MNLRILKKLSKRAAPLLPLLGDDREQFPAEKGENYHGLTIKARKHWERHSCYPGFKGLSDSIQFVTRTGRSMTMYPPNHPLEGTIMVGSMSGYYEPEWEEQCAYTALHDLIYWHFVDVRVGQEEGDVVVLRDELVLTRDLSNPSLIFKAAEELIQQRKTQQ